MPLEGAYAFGDVGAATVTDLSGHGRHITLSGTNGAQVDSGGLLDGGALGKTGANTISLPAALRIASESDDRTLMIDGLGGRSVWWVRWESTALSAGVWGLLSLDAATIVTRARDQSNGSPTPAGSTVGALSSTVRHNFAITYVRSTGVLSRYYDGTPVGIQNHPPGTALYVGADDLNIAEWTSAGPALDNLRIFSHALTDAEVLALAGTPVTAGDFALPMTPASETDSAMPFGATKARTLGVAAVVETAQPLGRHKALALGTAYDVDTAQPLGRGKARALPAAVETDSPLGFGAAKTRHLGTANETDTALSFNQPVITVGPPDVGAPQTVTAVSIGEPERVDLVHVGTT